jgi:hypothetical protein
MLCLFLQGWCSPKIYLFSCPRVPSLPQISFITRVSSGSSLWVASYL